ncbi:MAG: hypothetical protein ACR2PS_01825 [Pseudomonadales bacterium]
MHTRRKFFTLSSVTAVSAALLPAVGIAKSDAELESDDLSGAVPSTAELESEFERYLTGATAGQCEGARQMCAVGKESAHD